VLRHCESFSCGKSIACEVRPELFVRDVIGGVVIVGVEHLLDQNPNVETFTVSAAVSHLTEDDGVFVNDDLHV